MSAEKSKEYLKLQEEIERIEKRINREKCRVCRDRLESILKDLYIDQDALEA